MISGFILGSRCALSNILSAHTFCVCVFFALYTDADDPSPRNDVTLYNSFFVG